MIAYKPAKVQRQTAHRWSLDRYSTYFSVSLCGLSFATKELVPVEHKEVGSRTVRMCGNCRRARLSRVTSPDPEITPKVASSGAAIQSSDVCEITGRLFRVRGSKGDVYTVTIPTDGNTGSSCTCMAAKTRPGVMCKHQAAVYFQIDEEWSRIRGVFA